MGFLNGNEVPWDARANPYGTEREAESFFRTLIQNDIELYKEGNGFPAWINWTSEDITDDAVPRVPRLVNAPIEQWRHFLSRHPANDPIPLSQHGIPWTPTDAWEAAKKSMLWKRHGKQQLRLGLMLKLTRHMMQTLRRQHLLEVTTQTRRYGNTTHLRMHGNWHRPFDMHLQPEITFAFLVDVVEEVGTTVILAM